MLWTEQQRPSKLLLIVSNSKSLPTWAKKNKKKAEPKITVHGELCRSDGKMNLADL